MRGKRQRLSAWVDGFIAGPLVFILVRGEGERVCGGGSEDNLNEGVDGLEVEVVGGFVQEEQVRSQQTQIREDNTCFLACSTRYSVLVRPGDDPCHVQSMTLTARQVVQGDAVRAALEPEST